MGSEQTHGGQQKQNLLYDMTLQKNFVYEKMRNLSPPLPPHLSIGLFCILHWTHLLFLVEKIIYVSYLISFFGVKKMMFLI